MTIQQERSRGRTADIATRSSPAVVLASVLAIASLGASCSDEGTGPDRPDREGPLYVVSHSVFTQDGSTSYLTVVDSLGLGPAIDLARSLELGGGARAYGPEGTDIVYVTSSEDGTMTEVAFGRDGSPRLGRTVSFASLGVSVTTGGNVHHFVSPSKAYFVSQATLEAVVWNPAAMEIITTIPLGLQAHAVSADAGFYFYPRPILVGDRLVLIANQTDGDDIDGPAVLAVLDLTTDRVLSITAETRCQAMLQSAVDTRGDRYFAASKLSAAKHFLLPDRAPAPCMLRMRAGDTSFDAAWSRTLATELGTGLWTGVTPGAGGKLYEQSIAEDAPAVVAAAASLDPYEVSIAEPWRWHSQQEGEGPLALLEADFLSTPPLFAAIPVDGAAYVSLWDETDTTLVDLTSSDSPRKGLVVPGFVYNVVRIR
jgi:hypothetical protein